MKKKLIVHQKPLDVCEHSLKWYKVEDSLKFKVSEKKNYKRLKSHTVTVSRT